MASIGDEFVGVSIIVCCYNSQSKLSELFSYFEKLNFEIGSTEIILIDNCSNDNTFEIGNELIESCKFSGLIIKESQAGLSFAREAGILIAKYDLILFCDDDNFLSPDYLNIGFDYFSKYPDLGCLGGHGMPKLEISKPKWFDNFANSYAVGSLGKKEGIQSLGSTHYGAGLFFRTESLKRFYEKDINSTISDRKGGQLSSGGDSELCLAIQMEGYKLAYSPELKFFHKIETERLTKSYYLKLRKGILSNFPILESYSYLLAKKRTGFIASYFLRIPALLFNLFKTILKYLFHRDFVHQVHYLIYWWKLKGLIFNFRTSYKLFKELKSKYSL